MRARVGKKSVSFKKFVDRRPWIRVLAKGLVSLWVVYHLVVIVIMPQPLSLLYAPLKPYLMPYAYTLKFSNIWSFFAPNPDHYSYFEYDVYYESSVRHQKTKKGRRGKRSGRFKTPRQNKKTFIWPLSRKESERVSLNHNRLIWHSIFFYHRSSPRTVRRYLLPFLCRLHPRGLRVVARAMRVKRPPFSKARGKNHSFHSMVYRGRGEPVEKFQTARRCPRNKNLRQIDSVDSTNGVYFDKDPL